VTLARHVASAESAADGLGTLRSGCSQHTDRFAGRPRCQPLPQFCVAAWACFERRDGLVVGLSDLRKFGLGQILG
jgi:hypothetical protein